MFAAATYSPFGRTGALAQAYRQVGVATSVSEASPHKLIDLLFDGVMESIAQARGAMQARQIEAKGRAISRAARIVDEGLRAGLNLTDGGRLAADLQNLYEYIGLRLILANVRTDVAILDECAALLEPLRQAWKDIGPQVEGQRQ
jgi:flagellar secretion chaperone FliS